MADNLSVRITADTADLQAKFAVAKAESAALTAELNRLAREARGGMTDALKGKLTSAAEAMLNAKARTSELGTALRSELEPNIRSASSALTLAKEAAGAFGLALSAGAAVSFGRGLLESTAAIASEARAVGVSTDSLQSYRAAAVEAGGSTEQADQAIRFFTKSLGLAADSNNNQRKAFVDLGLAASDLAGGTEASLPKVAASLLAISDATRRAADEAALFGRSGQDVERFLQAWADPNIVAAMKADGQVIDAELIQRAEKFESEWSAGWTRFKVEAVAAIGTASDAIDGYIAKAKQFFATLPAGVTAEGQPFGGGLATTPWSGQFANASTQALAQQGTSPSGGGQGGGYAWMNDERSETSEHLALILEMRRQNDALIIQDIENTSRAIEEAAKAEEEARERIQVSIGQSQRQFDEDRIRSAEQIEARIAEISQKSLETMVKYGQELDHDQAQQDQKAADERARSYMSMLGPFNSAIGQMLSGHANYAQIAVSLERGLIMKTIEGFEQSLIAWAVTDSAKTAITQGGTDARTAITEAGATAGTLADTAGMKESAIAHAYHAAVAAYDDGTEIPVVGWAIAPGIAASALAFAMGLAAAIPSFDVGAYNIGGSGLAMVHAGEMIAPARVAEGWRDNFNSNSSTTHHHWNISNTINAAGGDIAGALESHRGELARVLGRLIREGGLR